MVMGDLLRLGPHVGSLSLQIVDTHVGTFILNWVFKESDLKN